MSRVRIVGGQWRSRLLDVAQVQGLRPTPDRVRETVFNWLGQDLDGQHCLDLFAGTGILGFEAASRGAAGVVLVERDARALDALHKSAKTLQASQVEIVRGDAVRFAQTTPRRFDGVFLDPPYKQGWIERVAPWLDRIVQPGGWLYVEAEAPVTSLGKWHVVRQGHAGQVHFHLMRGSDE
ncbi:MULTISPECIES: 16S rRNA (guanine(966)-N(2))-methyltransferase RsmD [unclassified Thauera]|uniref:16S rRNA (guanine(966)-N(2))-methyltransferase RsmD n=1 Tax=unclassified Thauera TaxID=2609274 RepID=UPI0002CD9807|nr:MULTISPECIES: 16S rRNA (guanine(966)-N(2))-methyltransferase RsmD [unclassified Thauera]ENO91709.1 methyltransferase [Thauera sp. 28]WBL64967.1 16S rRNA (guanine(966)-N(2))-methyltransferase RsmD [Thauera sp. WB-2]HNR61068.1 16S rRNA (guanine(966)-N(2))-methyltransferase RsmD [Thauera sp.]HNS91662.1 16S rRNA (guanine(966)-N(2))-methyltransferase RsmD [Thauera sp.]HRJ24194.1 16S rRNA (guanine(966)-N(2))-methyltransferase RsmD [Thauera sp.]